MSPPSFYYARAVVGTRRKRWQILNEMGGCVEYFDGTKKSADARAKWNDAERARLAESLRNNQS